MSNLQTLIAELPPEKRGLLTRKLRMLNAESGGSSSAKITRSRRYGDGSPLSYAQQRLWFLDQLEPNSPAYNIPSAARISGNLDVAALGRAINEIVRRHEVLRTIFVTSEGQPRQVATDHQPRALEVVDLSRLPQAERESEIWARTAAEARRPFDLSRGPMLRAELLRLAEDEHVLLLTMHHIVSDGWSAGVLVREMAALYAAYAEGRESPLAELPIQYADYAQWQREWLKGAVLEEQLGYWRKQLAGAPPLLELPTDRPRPASQSFRGGRVSFALGPELSKELQSLSRREGATLFMTLLTAWQILLSRYSGQKDICVGSPIAGRTRAEVEGLIGFFVNTLVIRGDLSGDPPFSLALRRVKDACLGAYAHQDAPFEKLVEELRPERSLTNTPLFQVCFVLQNASILRLDLQGLKLRPFDTGSVTAKFDLTLLVSERNGVLDGTIEYSSDLFEAETIHGLSRHFQTLLGEIASKPAQRISWLALLTSEERRELLTERNKMLKDELPLACLHEGFELQAVRRPESIAVACEGEQLTYRELDRRANQLAGHLRRLGVGAETRVALLLERSVEMVVGLVGTLKAGGAYVPLDPQYPQERLSFMLADSGAEVLLTQGGLRSLVPECAARVVEVDGEWERDSEWSGEKLRRVAEGGNLAYVIYTSGSTGRPKGVMIEHRQLSNYVHAAVERLRLPEGAGYATVSTFAADLGHTMIFPALSGGGALHVLSRERAAEGEWVWEYLERNRVECLKIVPSHIEAICEGARGSGEEERREGESEGNSRVGKLRRLVLGGEASRWSLIERLRRLMAGCEIYNHYGPTETTVGAVAQMLEGEEKERAGLVGLGRPMGNMRAYVMREEMEVVGVGEVGELYIGGAGVGRGYLGGAEQTAERYVPDPNSERGGERLYRTGDVARYRPDGVIEFLGRVDNQIKIRGFRIEIGEIETALVSHPSVREAIVLVREDAPGEKRLIAYVVGARHQLSIVSNELRAYLKERLPEYMLPLAFIQIDALPLSPNGKVDRLALPSPEQMKVVSADVRIAPRTPLEEILCGIWQEVLRTEKVGVTDNFFELGGHSLLVTQVISRVREVFRVELPVRRLFDAVTIEQLSRIIIENETKPGQTERIARTLETVRNMPEEERRKILQRKREEMGVT
jgi:amino acid adenylation domain-containing protein